MRTHSKTHSRFIAARRRMTANALPILMALQLVSPAWAASYVARVPANISPEALLPELTIAPAQVDFGEVTVTESAMASSTLTNKGAGSATLIFSSVPEPYAFSHDCVNPLPGGQNCSLNFTFTPATNAPQPDATLSISGGRAPVQVQLEGSGRLPLAAIGELKAITSADFGTVTLGSTEQRTFTFKNVGGVPASGIHAVIPVTTGLTMGINTCGTQASPITLSPNGQCSSTLLFGGSVNASLSGAALSMQGGFANSPQAIQLSGTAGLFNSQGAWSSIYSNQVGLTTANKTFPTLRVNTTSQSTFYVRNIGTNGAISMRFQVSGDTTHFNYIGVRKFYRADGSAGTCGGDGLATFCVSDDVNGGSYPGISVIVRYTPKAAGNHTITLTPHTNNGTVMPEAMTFTGNAN